MLEAEAALSFTLEQPQQNNSDVAARLYTSLREWVEERRTKAAIVLQALHTNMVPTEKDGGQDLAFPFAPSEKVREYVLQMTERMGEVSEDVMESTEEDNPPVSAASTSSTTVGKPLSVMLQETISHARDIGPNQTGQSTEPSALQKAEVKNMPLTGKTGM